MSELLLIDILEKMVKLHKSLHAIAGNKTEVIKKGDIEPLQQIMKDEQAHIMSIQKLETARQNVVKQIAPELLQPSLTDCIQRLNQEEAAKVSGSAEHLKQIIMDLKETNTLNQQLLIQSLQFVNVSLNALKPTNRSINYGKPLKGDAIRTDTIGKQSMSLLNIKA
ncbi:flagellar protein FlgN [Niallia nealsonii]|uniref:Flagellar protein FlgN n=1 Tax=Niallia nealsonii TaxID=115979 RepID=A0A2N0YXU3_9BACI|nr:flagellar protein FlgN [Niallia nealsonii]PKG22084.1 flagellar protein FlgN [Niallia nealsonii]